VYESHFALSSRPFAETVSPDAFVALASRESALRRLRYGLEHGAGPALVLGEPGTGKTLLARVLARALGGPCTHLAFPAMPAAELLAYLADELGAPPAPAGAGEATPALGTSVRRLRATLSMAVARGEHPLLIVDEAHLIDDPATFETFRLLLNFATAGPPDLRLLLVGAPEVLLQIPPGLSDRLTARCLLGPLAEHESAAYIQGRLAMAGGNASLFPADALAALHRASEGLPRRLNRLADLALLIAYAQGLPHPDAATVAIAARECLQEPLAA
jgi:type II secretory pathway predicted ATPase ExeA